MFTGIVEEIGRIVSTGGKELIIHAHDVLQDMEVGGSIAVNGVCLTVTDFTNTSFSVDLMPETLQQTNLSLLIAGSEVNLERPLTLNKQLGGHLVQGHIDAIGMVASITRDREAVIIRFEAPTEVMHYVVKKGFIAINGVSLTILSRDNNTFRVSIVDFTGKHTILGSMKTGDQINIEVDIIAKYVEQFKQSHNNNITIGFLQEHGFLET
jgi:riboflavin synthase